MSIEACYSFRYGTILFYYSLIVMIDKINSLIEIVCVFVVKCFPYALDHSVLNLCVIWSLD